MSFVRHSQGCGYSAATASADPSPTPHPPAPQGVANRDIKLDNLLLQPIPGLARPLLKVCDFGYSKQDERLNAALSRVGTVSGSHPFACLSVHMHGRGVLGACA